jgi:hypothetical protein
MGRLAGAAALCLALAAVARAQEPPEQELPLPAPEPGPPRPLPDPWMDIDLTRSWSELPPRLFIATTVDIGWIYLRPRLSGGWGRPHTAWVGFDVNPTFSANALGFYGGLRLALPRLNWRVGARYNYSLGRAYLDDAESFDRTDFDLTTNDRSRYLTLETEVEWSLPVGGGDLVGLASLSYVSGVPEDKFVFEETLRVMVDPNWVWRVRGGYTRRFGTRDQHSAGVVVDVLAVPGRDDSLTVRAGPIVRIVLSRRVEVRGSFVATVASPDSLGLAGSDFTEIGLRYRWASE